MDEPVKPLQYGLKWLFAIPALIGLVLVLYHAGLPSELLFVLLACPVLLIGWILLSRVVARVVTDLFG